MKKLFSFLDEKRQTIIFAVIFGLGLLAYRPSLSAPFYFDDYSRIADNSFIKHFNPDILWQYDPSCSLTNLFFDFNFLAVTA